MLVQKHGISGRWFARLKLLGTVLLAAVAVLVSGCSDKVLQYARVNHPVSAPAVKLLSLKPSPDSAKPYSASSGVKVPGSERRFFGLLPAKKAPEKTLEGFSGGKFKNKGTIIYQVGTGNTAAQATKPGTMATGTDAVAVDAGKAKAPVQTGTGNQATDNTKAGQRGGAAATAPNAVATATTEKENWLSAVLPWAAGALGAWALLPFLPVPGAGWLWLLLARGGRSRDPDSG